MQNYIHIQRASQHNAIDSCRRAFDTDTTLHMFSIDQCKTNLQDTHTTWKIQTFLFTFVLTNLRQATSPTLSDPHVFYSVFSTKFQLILTNLHENRVFFP